MKLKYVSILALVSVIGSSGLLPVSATPSTNKFDVYRNQIIQDELALARSESLKQSVAMEYSSSKLSTRIEELNNAEIVELNFGEDGELLSAESSSSGNVENRFVEEVIEEVPPVNDLPNLDIPENEEIVSPTAIIPNPSTPPAGHESGAFQRFKTPTSSSLTTSYTGIVADSLQLPSYDTDKALNPLPGESTEAAWIYAGFDNPNGIAEVGFNTTRQTQQNMPSGWYPAFHAKMTTSTGISGKYLYDSTRRYNSGAIINSVKIYYKYSTTANLQITFMIGASSIYVINYTFPASNISTKRVTAIGMNGNPASTDPFRVPYATNAVWNNMRFLYNNGTETKTPAQVPNLVKDYWNHGGIIDYQHAPGSVYEYIRIYK